MHEPVRKAFTARLGNAGKRAARDVLAGVGSRRWYGRRSVGEAGESLEAKKSAESKRTAFLYGAAREPNK